MLQFDRRQPKMRSFRLYRGGALSGAWATLGSYFILVYVLPVIIFAVAALIRWLQG